MFDSEEVCTWNTFILQLDKEGFFPLFLFLFFCVFDKEKHPTLLQLENVGGVVLCFFFCVSVSVSLCDKVEHWNTSLCSSWTMEEGGRKELSDLLINSRLLGVTMSRSLSENKGRVQRLAFASHEWNRLVIDFHHFILAKKRQHLIPGPAFGQF